MDYPAFRLANISLFGTNGRGRRKMRIDDRGGANLRHGGFSAYIIDCLQSHEEGLVMEAEIESVARALYSAEDDAQVWDREPDIIKDEFRLYALAALELLAEHRKPKVFAAEICLFPYAA